VGPASAGGGETLQTMDMAVEELAGGVTKIILRGRFDTTGAIAVEMPFNALAGEHRALVVDLCGLTFLSSYGIRVLLVGAKIARSKGGKLVLLCPKNDVSRVLETARANDLIPVLATEADATAAAL
jgi:anti-anti-sigma factor